MSKVNEVNGVVLDIFPVKEFSETFKTQEFGIQTDDDYPQQLKLQVNNNKISLLDGIKVGDVVNVKINLRGTKKEGKYFTNLEAWAINKKSGSAGGQDSAPTKPAKKSTAKASAADDDLPF